MTCHVRPVSTALTVQVEETLPAEVLAKMHAPDKPDVPVISAKELPDADGFVFGMPTRYGMMAAQVKALWDSTGSLWQAGAHCTALFVADNLGALGVHVLKVAAHGSKCRAC